VKPALAHSTPEARMPMYDDLLTPIAGANPAGANLRYELYELVREARREETDAPTGGWDRPGKTADWAFVENETTQALATKSKDLLLAVWLIEAAYHRESFAGFDGAVRMTAALIEKFWDHLYPELEDGDPEARIAPLAWLGSDRHRLPQAIRLAPITSTGLTIFQFRDALNVGFESEADDYYKQHARKKRIDSGKMSAEEFEPALAATPKAWYKRLSADLASALEALDTLTRVGNEKFGYDAPEYNELRNPIEDLHRVVRELLVRKLTVEPDPLEPAPDETRSFSTPASEEQSPFST
jgi:type VI secretion system protein ImpA